MSAAWMGPPPRCRSDELLALIAQVEAGHDRLRGALAAVVAWRLHPSDRSDLPVLDAIDAIEAGLTAHLAKVDRVLMPTLRQLASPRAGITPPPPLADMIQVLELEHDRAWTTCATLITSARVLRARSDRYRQLETEGTALAALLGEHIAVETRQLLPCALARETEARTWSRSTSRS